MVLWEILLVAGTLYKRKAYLMVQNGLDTIIYSESCTFSWEKVILQLWFGCLFLKSALTLEADFYFT